MGGVKTWATRTNSCHLSVSHGSKDKGLSNEAQLPVRLSGGSRWCWPTPSGSDPKAELPPAPTTQPCPPLTVLTPQHAPLPSPARLPGRPTYELPAETERDRTDGRRLTPTATPSRMRSGARCEATPRLPATVGLSAPSLTQSWRTSTRSPLGPRREADWRGRKS